MTQFYTEPERETDPHSLPDAEVFYMSAAEFENPDEGSWMEEEAEQFDNPQELEGYYWWNCFPGCMPESEPDGPYPSEAAAIQAAQEKQS